MLNRSRALLSCFVATLLSGPAWPAAHRAVEPVVNVGKKRKHGLFNGVPHPSSPSLAGGSALRLSAAQIKRNAAKRRNQRRHKRHVRG